MRTKAPSVEHDRLEYNLTEEPLVLPRQVVDLLLSKDHDALLFLCACLSLAKCSDIIPNASERLYSLLGWGNNRMASAKRTLTEEGLVKTIVYKDEFGKILGWGLRLSQLWSSMRLRGVQTATVVERTSVDGETFSNAPSIGVVSHSRRKDDSGPLFIMGLETNSKTRPRKGPKWLDLFPDHFREDPDFCKSWTDFEKERQSRGHAITKIAAERLVRKMWEWKVGEAVAALEQSIESGWTGLWKVKQVTQRREPTPLVNLPVHVREAAELLSATYSTIVGNDPTENEKGQLSVAASDLWIVWKDLPDSEESQFNLDGTPNRGARGSIKKALVSYVEMVRLFCEYMVKQYGKMPDLHVNSFLPKARPWTAFVRLQEARLGMDFRTGARR